MENLLLEILKSPTDASIQRIEHLLDTNDGEIQFINLLLNNNIIAFTYLKMQIKEWINNPTRLNFLLKYKNTFYNLIYTCTDQNLNLLSDFMEILFFYYRSWPDLVDFLVSQTMSEKGDLCVSDNRKSETPDKVRRSIHILSNLFQKFTKLKKSNELYTEILNCIEKTKPIFVKYYFTNNPLDDKNLLTLFYNLIYQDISEFFEINIEKFLSTFCILFKEATLQIAICEIYNLIVTKYYEIVDSTKILGSVLVSITKYEYIKYQVILNILKRRDQSIITKFRDVLINVVKLGSNLLDQEKEEMYLLEYNRNILNNIDIYRGIITEIATILVNSDNTKNLLNSLLNSQWTEESEIFIHIALKERNEEIIKKCLCIINNYESDKYLSFTAFRYLLSMKEYAFCDIRFLDRNHPAVYLCMKMLIEYIQKVIPVERNIISYICNAGTPYNIKNPLSGSIFSDQSMGKDIPLNITNQELFNKLMIFMSGFQEDEYSSTLLNRLVKYNLLTHQDSFRFILEYIVENLRNINNRLAYINLFDILGILFLNKKISETEINSIINIVISEEIVEIYREAFYLLSIVVLNSTNDYSSVVQIISQDKLWTSKELYISLICLTVSTYKRNYLTVEQVNYISNYLEGVNKYYSSVLLNNCGIPYISQSEDAEEYFIEKSMLIKCKEEYIGIYNNALEYFSENYITKKNVRRVLRAFVKGGNLLGDMKYMNIIEKNMFNVGFENVPYSIILTFDI